MSQVNGCVTFTMQQIQVFVTPDGRLRRFSMGNICTTSARSCYSKSDVFGVLRYVQHQEML
jgi:hypothetical protein